MKSMDEWLEYPEDSAEVKAARNVQKEKLFKVLHVICSIVLLPEGKLYFSEWWKEDHGLIDIIEKIVCVVFSIAKIAICIAIWKYDHELFTVDEILWEYIQFYFWLGVVPYLIFKFFWDLAAN